MNTKTSTLRYSQQAVIEPMHSLKYTEKTELKDKIPNAKKIVNDLHSSKKGYLTTGGGKLPSPVGKN